MIVALPGLFSYLFLLFVALWFVARRGSSIGFNLLWYMVELAMSTRLCLFVYYSD